MGATQARARRHPLRMRTIDRAAWREQPWKNGRGTTLEIVRWRLATDIDRHATRGAEGRMHWAFDDTNDDDYDVRVSLADVRESGAFSTFPGYRRHTFLVGRAPIRLGDISLVAPGDISLLAPGDHVELPGDRAIEATLSAGPTQLLNVLVRASLSIVVGYGPTAQPVVFAFELSMQTAWSSELPATISSRDSMWLA
jgi:environmental stress-induced protein Ves